MGDMRSDERGGRRIATKEAALRTAMVEIKSLTVSGKQMTLAVFRQLLAEDVIDRATTTLRGVPWGTVNYFWKGCAVWDQDGDASRVGDNDRHIHVVWQQGGELRRDCVYQDGSRVAGMEPFVARESAEKLATLLLHHRILSGAARSHGGSPSIARLSVSIDGEDIDVWVKDDVGEIYANRGSASERARLEGKLSARIERNPLTASFPTEDTVMGELRRTITLFKTARERYTRIYEDLAALNQLFIAV